ncbi:hypothetical protein GNI_152870 [Gregarina niphandrodes]|uniref:Uncharacterized protein n=1 Tax=Gregarina niphandrodes TaxID=110365 RepID=A0A023AZB7_GRENI|nr:hypothetical protein GNI_152870 [Gregarina niphandrodes]EZG44067.1 hypothetical protein GNI_152870 [Gregarina niphandrodes]|eukprot:XP_011132824.1 hypothetical protein GNI_152870 [Gregarina niphandrodes]
MRGAACARRRPWCPELLACCFELVEVEPAELAALQTAYRYGTRFFRMRLRELEDAGWGCVLLDPTQVRASHVSESHVNELGSYSGHRVYLHYLAANPALDALGEPAPPPAWIAANALSFMIDSVDEDELLALDLSDDPGSAADFFRTLLTVSASQLGLALDQLDPACLQGVAEDFVGLHREEKAVERWLESLRREFAQPLKRIIRLDHNHVRERDLTGEHVARELTAAGGDVVGVTGGDLVALDVAGEVQEAAAAGRDAARQAVAVLAKTVTIREIGRGNRNFMPPDELLSDVAEAKSEWEARMPRVQSSR